MTKELVYRNLIRISIIILLIHFSIRCIAEATTSTFSFDGAMNAQVSQNLLKNLSYSTNYDGGQEFDQRIQTGIPVVLPVALSFSLFGETFPSGLLINSVYLILLLLCIVYLLYKILKVNEVLILIFILFFYSTPKLFLYGFGLFGEIPTLFYLILFFIFFSKFEETKRTRLLIISGLILSFGYLTKTIILITAPAVVMILISEIIKKRSFQTLYKLLWNFGVGFFIPILAFESFKFISLGNIGNYIAWWKLQLYGVFQQAGFAPGFNDSNGIFSKLNTHIKILSSETQVSIIILLLYILVILGLFFFLLIYNLTNNPKLFLGPISKAKVKLMILITSTTLTYICWWLFITPSQKAWYRRIINGYILMEICIILILFLIYRLIQNNVIASIKFSKLKFPTSFFFITLFVFLNIISKNYVISFTNTDEKKAVKQASDFIKMVPNESIVYGYNWWQSPILAFETKRSFYDINQDFNVVLPGKLHNKYLVRDPDASIHGIEELEEILRNFEHNQVFSNDYYLIYSIDEKKFPTYVPFSDQEELMVKNNYIDFSKDPVIGFYRNVFADEQGSLGKWTKMYSGYLLKYSGESNLTISAWFPELISYPYYPINLEIYINKELITSIEIEKSGIIDINIPISNIESDPIEVSLFLNSRLYPENDTRELAFRIININLQ